MSKFVFIMLMLFIGLTFNLSFAKEVELTVMAKASDISTELSEEQLLTLNGYRQVVTSELVELKLNSDLFWSKLGPKNLSAKAELAFLQNFFENVSLSMAAPSDAAEPRTPDSKLTGNFKATIDLLKLKMSFIETTTDLGETKLKTFYLIANIDLDANLTWDEVGVVKAETFRGVILDSWKKLIEKDIKGFERVVFLDKDLSLKPDFMNSKSVTLKWTSTLKKVSSNTERHSAGFELSADYVIQNSKSGSSLYAIDFPTQKRDFDIQNKKALSSALASLVYNLLLSQASKINGVLEVASKTTESAEVEIKIISKVGLTEINQINLLLQDKFKNLKLTSQMKSYSSDGSTLSIRAEGSSEIILDNLSLDGGKYPLNEQKVLLFNRSDKTFAILPKGPNN